MEYLINLFGKKLSSCKDDVVADAGLSVPEVETTANHHQGTVAEVASTTNLQQGTVAV